MSEHAGPLRGLVVGAVPYLNVAPLIAGLGDVRALRPSDLAVAIDRGEVDLATLPIGAMMGRPDLAALPSTGIGCDGPVRTVLLEPLEAIDSARGFRPDPASRTSNLLARLLLSRRWGREPLIDDDANLRVVIGDPAFEIPPAEAWDLGAAWKDWTGLPFVFALWVAGPRLASDSVRMAEVDAALRERTESNLLEIDRICQEQSVVPPAVAREYLTLRIRHVLDERFRSGADRFASELRDRGWVDGGIRWAC